jgi:hypothetical protein
MLIYFGSRTTVNGPGYLIASVVRTDASNGTLTLESGLAAAQSSQPFLIDLAQAGNASAYASFLGGRILNAMTEILGLGTTVDNTSKQIVLNSATSGALGRILWEIAGVDQFRIDRQQIGGVEHLAIQSTNDGGTNWVNAIQISRTTGAVTFAAAPTFSSPLLLPAGSASAPALSRTGDTNTGLLFPAADTVAVATDGVERLRVTATGNVGVGVTPVAPARLHVAGGPIVARRDTTGTFGDFDSRGHLILEGSTNPNLRLGLGVDTTASPSVGVVQSLEAGVNVRALALNPAGGFVGVGTSTPAARLNVTAASGEAAIAVGTVNPVTFWTSSVDANPAVFWKAGAAIRFGHTTDGIATAGFAERMRIIAGGSVGIATNSPTAQLHVAGPIRHAVFTVATLPAAGTVGAGTRAAVTDSNATTFNAIVAGGGSSFVPVISDGTNWRIG